MKLLFSVLLLVMGADYAFSAKILGYFMTPSYSHQIVYQPIWRELSLRGHEVTVITPNPLNDPKLSNLTEIDVSSSYKIFRGENEKGMLTPKSLLGEFKRFGKIYDLVAHDQLSNPEVQALFRNKNETFDLVLVEYLYPAMYALKDVYNCPIIGITSLGLTAFGNSLIGNPKNPAFEPDMFLQVSINKSFKERFISAVVDFLGRTLPRYVQLRKMNKMVSQYISNEVRPLQEICQEFSLVIVNSNLAIRNAKPTVPNLIEISGIHLQKPKQLPKDLKNFLDSATEGVIYFSLGTNMKSAMIPQEKLDIILQVFAELPYKILWKFEKEHLPNQPSNVFMQKWLAQQDVLHHPNVKAFISQAGIQSIDEAVFASVPLLLIPIFGDQDFNAHHMVTRGAALSLNFQSLNKENFKKSILELMNNPKYQNNMNKLSSIASDQMVPALDKAVWWIEYVMRHDGAEHLRYAGRNVPFYQFYMLDILAVIILSLIVVCYLIVYGIKYTLQFFRISKNYMHRKIKRKED